MGILDGKKCLVTGANSGLGFAVTRLFAKSGAEVIMLCRDESKAKKAIEDIRREIPDSRLQPEICDLSSIKSVRAFIDRFRQNHITLDVLFNNAAVMRPEYSETDDGIETMFQTNFIAPQLIANSLIEIMKKSHGAKVINIALPPDELELDFSDLQSKKRFDVITAFFRTKLCLLLYSLELSGKVKGSTVSVISTDPGPGAFDSNLVREFPLHMRESKKLSAKDVNTVAENILYYVKNVGPEDGVIFKGREKVQRVSYWENDTIRKRLLEETDKIVAGI